MAEIVIRHTREDGTILEGSRTGDGVYEIARSAGGFAWRRSIGILLLNSRDRIARRWQIDAAAAALRAAGHQVEVVIDDVEHRTIEQVRDARYGRVDDRAERLDQAAARATGRAEAAHRAACRIAEGIPPGQPDLVDHYSYRRTRRARERLIALDCQSAQEYRNADRLSAAAEVAADHRDRRENPGVVQRRIERNEAEVRSIDRLIQGTGYCGDSPASGEWLERLRVQRADLTATIEADQRLIAAAEAKGFTVWSRKHFQKGDGVRYRSWTLEVFRVNPKGLTVQQPYMPKGCRTTIKYVDGIEGRVPAEQFQAALAEHEAAAGIRHR